MRVGMSVMGLFAATLCAPWAAGAQRPSGSVERAHREGKQAFAAGDYETAADRFDEAYLLSDDPTYLFNLAQAQRLDGDCRAAYRSYGEFLKLVPDAPNRADVEEKIAGLERCARPPARLMPVPVPAQAAVSPHPLAPTRRPARRSPEPRRLGLKVAFASGLVMALVVGVAATEPDAGIPVAMVAIPVGFGLMTAGVVRQVGDSRRAAGDL